MSAGNDSAGNGNAANDNAAKPGEAQGARMMIALVGVAALCGVLIVLAFQWSLPIITEKKAEALRRAVYRVLPAARSMAVFREEDDGSLVAVQGKSSGGLLYYAGYDEEQRLAGVAIEARGQGYQDMIKIIYGYAPQTESIVGMAVLESKETPGLGDKIGKEPRFLANFHDLDVGLDADGSRLRNKIEVVKQGAKQARWQIDAITGATISSKAVGRLLNASVAERLPRVRGSLRQLEEGAR